MTGPIPAMRAFNRSMPAKNVAAASVATIRSERNFVVHVVALAAAAGHRRLARGHGALGTEIAIGGIGAAAGTAAARAVEHGQLRIEALQHDLGRIFVLSVFVLPFARLQRALEINFCTFLQILLGDLREPFVEDDDAVPLGFLLALAARLVAPGF